MDCNFEGLKYEFLNHLLNDHENDLLNFGQRSGKLNAFQAPTVDCCVQTNIRTCDIPINNSASYTVANEAEGLIRFEVQNISSAGERLLSNRVFIRGLKWQILLMPKFMKENRPGLGIFIKCGKDEGSCRAEGTITLLNYKDPNRNITKKNHSFLQCRILWSGIRDLHYL